MKERQKRSIALNDIQREVRIH